MAFHFAECKIFRPWVTCHCMECSMVDIQKVALAAKLAIDEELAKKDAASDTQSKCSQ